MRNLRGFSRDNVVILPFVKCYYSSKWAMVKCMLYFSNEIEWNCTLLLINSVLSSHSKTYPKRAELPKPWRRHSSISTGVDLPAGYGDLHFGGRDAPTDRIEVTDRRRGLHLVHNVSLHACRRPRPAPRAAWVPLNLENRRRRAGAQRASEQERVRSR